MKTKHVTGINAVHILVIGAITTLLLMGTAVGEVPDNRYYVKSIISNNGYWVNLNNIIGAPDNNYATSSNPSHTMPQVVLDFGTTLTSGKIRIRLNDPYGSLTGLAVDVSDDISKEFIPAGRNIAGVSSGGIGDVEVTFPKMTFRYVKLYQSQTSPGQEDSIDSVEVVVDDASTTTGGLVAWYKFDEATGTVLRDSSGNGNHGTIYGATWTQGISGTALYFNGINNYVEIPDSPSLNPAQTTVIVWFKPEQRPEPINTRQFVISKGAMRNKQYPYEINLIKNSPRYQDNMILFRQSGRAIIPKMEVLQAAAL